MRRTLVAIGEARRSLPAYVGRAVGIGIVACALAALGYLVLLQARIGSFAFGGSGKSSVDKHIKVALLDSNATRGYMAGLSGASPGGYDRILKAWEGLLTEAGAEWHRVAAKELARGLGPSTVLVLPAAGALADETVGAVEAFLSRGGGVVATWQLALRNQAGRWRGFDLLARWLSFEPASWEGKETPRYLTLRAGGPLTAGIDAGARLALHGFDQPLLGVLPDPAALWTDWAMNPVRVEGRPLGAITTARFGRGRLVWFAFPVTLVGQGDRDQRILRRLVKNAIYWAGRRPLVHLLEWPEAAPAAAVFAMDTEHKFSNAARVARLFDKALAPVTFFCLSDLALSHSAVLRELLRVGEIGSHTDDHKPLAGLSLTEQVAHLEKSRRDLEALSGQPVRGFRSPEEKIDENTIRALRQAGYWYLAGDPQKPAAVPSLRRDGGRPLMIVPRVPLDDYDMIAGGENTEPARVAGKLEAEFDRVRNFGGLYFLSFHTEWLAQERYLPVLGETVRYARANGAWLATFGDLYRWWVARDGIRVALGPVGPKRLELRITNEGVAQVRGVSLAIHLGQGVSQVGITPDKIPAPQVSYELEREGEALIIELSVVAPGESEVYFIDFEPRAGS